MSTEDKKKRTPKEVMKALRESRQAQVKAATAKVKEQRRTIRLIKEQLKNGPGTVPEIATATGMNTDEVLWYVVSMKKYGTILEADKDGAYFRYQLADTATATD